MLLFNASLINITQSLLRLERARLLEAQSEQNDWINFKLSMVPYVYAEGNDKLFAKQVFSNKEVYQFFRETECEPTCYAINGWNTETQTENLRYTCTKHIDELNIDIYGLHSNTLCNYFAYTGFCRDEDSHISMGTEDAFREAAGIVTQSKWTWFYLVQHDDSLRSEFEGVVSMASLYDHLMTKVNPSIFDRFAWFDTHSEEGLKVAKAMATDVCDVRCQLRMASSSGEVHVDDSCVHMLNGVIYPVVYDYQVCPYVKTYVDCVDRHNDDITPILALVGICVVIIIIIAIIGYCCCRNRKPEIHVSEYSDEDTSKSPKHKCESI